MSDDKMRQEFEAWASERFLSIERLTAHKTVFDGQYASLDTQEAWTMWQAAYAAGRKAEREAFVSKLRSEIDHAALNAMQLKPMFGQSKGDLAVRVSTLEAIIENREGE